MKSLVLGRPLRASQDQVAVPSSTPRLFLAPGACLIREERRLEVRMLHYSYIPVLPLFPLGICTSLHTFHFMFFVGGGFYPLTICHLSCLSISLLVLCTAMSPQDFQLFFEITISFTHMLKLHSWPLMGCRPGVHGNKPSPDCYNLCHITICLVFPGCTKSLLCVLWESDKINRMSGW